MDVLLSLFPLRRSLQPRADMSLLLSYQLNYVSVILDRKNPEAGVDRTGMILRGCQRVTLCEAFIWAPGGSSGH